MRQHLLFLSFYTCLSVGNKVVSKYKLKKGKAYTISQKGKKKTIVKKDAKKLIFKGSFVTKIKKKSGYVNVVNR